MDAAPDWIISTVNDRIVSVSADYSVFTGIMKTISRMPVESVSTVNCRKVSTEEVLEMSPSVCWNDLYLFGTDFQKMVWRKLFDLTHPAPAGHPRPMSYTEFAGMCGKSTGVRAVAHAIAQNPVAIIIPCHLIVPKETMDKIEETERMAENSLFGTDGIIPDPSLDFGEYRYGKAVKKWLLR